MKDKKKYLYAGFYVTIVVSFLILLTALWLHKMFYSPENLANVTTEVLQEESSRNAISNVIVEKVFEDRPVLAATAGARLVPVVSGLLGSDVAANSIRSATERLRIALTTDEPRDISINVAPIKTTIVQIQSVIGQSDEEKRIDSTKIPDELVLVDSSAFPNYSDEGIVVLWLGPFAFTFIVVAGGTWIYRGRKKALARRIRILATLAAISALIGLLVGPLTEPIIIRYAKNVEGQTIVSNLYDAILASFNTQAIWLLTFAIVAFATTYILPVTQKRLVKKVK